MKFPRRGSQNEQKLDLDALLLNDKEAVTDLRVLLVGPFENLASNPQLS